jgi:ubiquinone/menaquinone biosynthesis C-methylase UbiE
MALESFDKTVYGGSAPERYEKCFVPPISAPLAADLIEKARLAPGQRVLDVACGTGVVTRLAAQEVRPGGAVSGLDLNPGMLDVARGETPPGVSIDWYEASAEAMPLPDQAFDVVLCQMGLQFVPNKAAAVREMWRVLAKGGRLVINLPGPLPDMLAVVADALARHGHPDVAPFVHRIFSLHDPDELRELATGAGFQQVDVIAEQHSLRLPPPEQFLWDYVNSTPIAAGLASATAEQCQAIERDVCARWRENIVDGQLVLRLRLSTVMAVK